MKRRSMVVLVLAALPLPATSAGADPAFVRADVNADGSIDLSDAVSALSWLFLGAPDPRCMDAGDANDDGKVDITDAIGILGYLFLGGMSPRSPFPDCGQDPTGDQLDCRSFPPCGGVNLPPHAAFSASASLRSPASISRDRCRRRGGAR